MLQVYAAAFTPTCFMIVEHTDVMTLVIQTRQFKYMIRRANGQYSVLFVPVLQVFFSCDPDTEQ